MLSLPLALRLRESGLVWEPKLHDLFTIPKTDFEKRLFVVSDIMVDVQQLFGHQMITFNGAVEWSLDYVAIAEAVWVPSEAQLRDSLWQYLQNQGQERIVLRSLPDSYTCKIIFRNAPLSFQADSASDAYAKALLQVLEHEAHGLTM
jgi:hypothetical protein